MSTKTCPSNHDLAEKGSSQSPPLEVKSMKYTEGDNVTWCDVCIKPYGDGAGFLSCTTCCFDICWKCSSQNRESYRLFFKFQTGLLKDQIIQGTLVALKPASANENDSVEVPKGGLYSLDFAINSVYWGHLQPEFDSIANAVVKFTKDKFEISSLSYENKRSKQDYLQNGRNILKFGIGAPLLFPNVPNEVKNENWVGVSFQTSDGTVHESFGICSFERFKLVDMPGFELKGGSPVETNETTLNLLTVLQEIAENKREVTRLRGAQVSQSRMKSYHEKLQDEEEVKNIMSTYNGVGFQDYTVEIDPVTKKSKFTPHNPNKSGKVHRQDLIFCARLSCLAYLIEPQTFNKFFPIEREEYLIDPVWTNFLNYLQVHETKAMLQQWLAKEQESSFELSNHTHEMFLAKFLADYFENDKTKPGFQTRIPVQDWLKRMDLEFLEGGGVFKSTLYGAGIEGILCVSTELYTKGGDICLIFQGTNEPKDFLVDFNGKQVYFDPFGELINAPANDPRRQDKRRVHAGFYNAFMKVLPLFEPALRKYIANTPKDLPVRIMVTGHSLGGALATLANAWLLELLDSSHGPKGIDGEITFEGSKVTNKHGQLEFVTVDRLRVECITFGSPKVGNHEFVNWYDDHPFLQWDQKRFNEGKDPKCRFKTLRLIDMQDPIACLPPNSLHFTHTTHNAGTIGLDGNIIFFKRDALAGMENETHRQFSNASSSSTAMCCVPSFCGTTTKQDQMVSANRAIRMIVTKGAKAIQYHDLFLYLHKTLHFTWKLYQIGKQEPDLGPDGKPKPALIQAFGDENYKYHDFVRKSKLRDF